MGHRDHRRRLHLLADRTFGWQFFQASNATYWGIGTSPIPVWGFPPLLISFMIPTTFLKVVFILLFGTWFLGWAGTLFLSSTRVIFAAAFDRILPERRRTFQRSGTYRCGAWS